MRRELVGAVVRSEGAFLRRARTQTSYKTSRNTSLRLSMGSRLSTCDVSKIRLLNEAKYGPPTKDMGMIKQTTPPGLTHRMACSRNRAYRFTCPSAITAEKSFNVAWVGRKTRP